MRTNRTPAESEQIKRLIQDHKDFYRVFQEDWTQNVLNDLSNRLYGKIPRNFLINISGLIGTDTGIFKSSMGLQIALSIDPLFDLKKRVAFSVNQLLDKIQSNSEFKMCHACLIKFKRSYPGTFEIMEKEQELQCDNCENVAQNIVLLTKLVFFLDEQTKSLRIGGLTRLQNLVDTVRQRQICFITCGVDAYEMNYSTYHLKRVQESHDDFLPKKKVRYAVYDDKRDIYYGYFQWDLTPLTDNKWGSFWKEYSIMKSDFQRIAIAQQISSMNFEEYAEKIMELDDFPKCFKRAKNGEMKLDSGITMTLIYSNYPDLTHNERTLILNQIKLMMKHGDNNE